MYKKIILIFISFLILPNVVVKAKELPKIYLSGDISNMNSKSDVRDVKFEYIGDNKFVGYAKIKIQGTSSLNYEKKNYTINLYKTEDFKTKAKVDFSWGDQSKYCLKANWIDKTHARNIVTARLASEIQQKYNLFENTPNYGLIDGYPVEIYINNDFLGLYTLNIPKDAWMFNMDENNSNHIMLVGDSWNSSVLFREEATWDGSWEVEVGNENDDTLKKLNRVINFVKNSTDEEFKNEIKNYINLDALINYYIIMETFDLQDNAGKNMLFITYDGLIWYPSLYDLDTSFGTDYTGLATWDYKGLISNDNLLFVRLKNNFSKEISERYFDLREEILTKDHILKQFNNFINIIPKSAYERERNRWQNIPGYDINQIRDFLNVRIPFIDNYMNELYPCQNDVLTNESLNKELKMCISVGAIIVSIIIIFIVVALRKRRKLN